MIQYEMISSFLVLYNMSGHHLVSFALLGTIMNQCLCMLFIVQNWYLLFVQGLPSGGDDRPTPRHTQHLLLRDAAQHVPQCMCVCIYVYVYAPVSN